MGFFLEPFTYQDQVYEKVLVTIHNRLMCSRSLNQKYTILYQVHVYNLNGTKELLLRFRNKSQTEDLNQNLYAVIYSDVKQNALWETAPKIDDL